MKNKFSQTIIFSLIILVILIPLLGFGLKKLSAFQTQAIPEPGFGAGYDYQTEVDNPRADDISQQAAEEARALQERTENNASASQAAASRLAELQQQDLEQCTAEVTGQTPPQGPMADTVNDSVEGAINNHVQENFQDTFTEEMDDTLPQETQNLVEESFPQELDNATQEILQDNPQIELLDADDPASVIENGSLDFNRAELDEAADAYQNYFGDNWREDILDEENRASFTENLFEETVQSVTPEVFEQVLTDNLPQVLENTMESAFSETTESIFNPDQLKEVFTDRNFQNNLEGGLSTVASDTVNGALSGLENLNESDLRETLGLPERPRAVRPVSQYDEDGYFTGYTYETGGYEPGTNLNLDDIREVTTQSMEDNISQNITDNLLKDENLTNLSTNMMESMNLNSDQIVGEMLDGLSMDGLTENLNLDSLTENLDLDSLNFDQAFGDILNDFDIDSVLDGFDIDNILGDFGGIGDIVGDFSNQITDMAGDVFGDITGDMMGDLNDLGIGLDLDSLPGPLNDIAGDITGGLDGSLPGAGGFGGGGNYVPVKEVDGPLLSTTQEIDATTKRMEQLLIQICTYQKSIQRIQTAFEQKEFMEDVQLRQSASDEVERYRQEVFDLTNRGYDPDGQGAEQPLYVTNLDSHLQQVKNETRSVYLNHFGHTENAFAEQVTNAIMNNPDVPALPESTITVDEYERFFTGQIADAEEYRRIAREVYNPYLPNTPQRAVDMHSALYRQNLQEKQDQAELEFNTGQGYLPVRECIEHTDDGSACLHWETITPASQIGEQIADVLSYRQEVYTNPQAGDIVPGSSPSEAELRNFRPSASGGSSSGSSGGSNSASMPGSSMPGSFDINQVVDMLSQFMSGLEGSDPDSSPSTASLAMAKEIIDDQNQAVISWSGEDVNSCQTDNNWISGNQFTMTGSGGMQSFFDHFIITKDEGEGLPNAGQSTIDLPVSLDVRFEVIRASGSNAGERRTITGGVTTDIIDDIYQEVTLNIPSVNAGDEFIISLFPHVTNYQINITASNGNASDLINEIRTEIDDIINNETGILKKNLSLLNIEYKTNSVTLSPKLKYDIKCLDNSGSTIQDGLTL
ncbi:MAG: hypothetical protein ACOCU8_02695 [Patescibacteria group bacterium]